MAAVGAFWLFFTFVTGTFLSSNMSKIPEGAWFRWEGWVGGLGRTVDARRPAGGAGGGR